MPKGRGRGGRASSRSRHRSPNTAAASIRAYAKSKLEFLCDANCPRDICSLINAIPGCHTRHANDLGLSNTGDLGIKEEAVRRKAIILTFDSDFIDPVVFKICTHPGVILLDMSLESASYIGPRLRAFFGARRYKKCKHAIVILQDELAIIRSPKGLVEIPYHPRGDTTERSPGG
jgi:predicted nuclease of predicted toxin-antitoxin system